MVGRVICLWGFSSVLIAWLFAWWVGGFLGGVGVGFGFFFRFFCFFFCFWWELKQKCWDCMIFALYIIGKLSHVTFVGPDKV